MIVLSNSYRINYYTGTFSACCIYISESISSYLLDIHAYQHWTQNQYAKDLKSIVAKTTLSMEFPHHKLKYYPHDRVELMMDAPTLVKSREITIDPHYSILMKLNTSRHYERVSQVRFYDIPFAHKQNKVLWRGSSTGYGFGNNIPVRIASREKLVLKYGLSKHPQIDIGLTKLVQNAVSKKKIYGNYLKQTMSLEQMLTYKYIISLEGNDVASDLKWLLYSNSIVFMPKPTIESWILESHLIPYYHYIPLDSDFSNLETQIQWCDSHPCECEQISRNATQYMSLFMEEDNEIDVMKKVLEYYLNHVQFMDDCNPLDATPHRQS